MATEQWDVVIVGAGVSGIGVAGALKARCPEQRFVILERRAAVGGTWDLFRYPGVRSDSDMHSYGYRQRPWDQTRVLADGDTIRDYLADTVMAHGLADHLRHGWKVVAADWSSAAQRWTVQAVAEADGAPRQFSCRLLVMGTGYYDHDAGHTPDFPGLERFGGTVVHPQHWPPGLDVSGRRVVVIGSGATAATLVPALARSAAHVTMLQRSPSYYFAVPSHDALTQALLRLLPRRQVLALARRRNVWLAQALYTASRRWPQGMRRLLQGRVEKLLRGSSDMRHFTPAYPPWDQRLCIVPDADLVVTATGLRLQALGGTRLSVDGQPYAPQQHMFYKAVLLEGLPNFAWVVGYTNASWTLKVDLVADYLCRLIRHMETLGLGVAVAHDDAGNLLPDESVMDNLAAGYIRRAGAQLPRQGRQAPWRVTHHHPSDRALLAGPIADGVLRFEPRRDAGEPDSGPASEAALVRTAA